MIDIEKLRQNPNGFKEAVARKGYRLDADAVLALDKTRRELIGEVDSLRQEANKVAKEGKDHGRGREIKEKIKIKEKELTSVEEQLNERLFEIPNPPMDDVPDGEEKDKRILRTWGEPRKFDFKPKDHVELGENLDIIDLDRAAKVTGARFSYLKNEAVWLEFALIRFAFDELTDQKTIKRIAKKAGNKSDKVFTPVLPPHMVRPETYIRMARLSKEDKDERYHLEKDDLYLIGSAEHALGPMHMDETIDESDSPIRYIGFSPSYRREAGAHGKDTRGILRVHQFDKVEMESISSAEHSRDEHELFIAIQEHLVQKLEIPHRVVLLATRDMGVPNARQVDIESWIPTQETYRETHTADYMTDYQARRLKTRIKTGGGKTEIAHTNDATVIAVGRTLIAILENFQQKDGSVKVPKALHSYLPFKEIKARK